MKSEEWKDVMVLLLFRGHGTRKHVPCRGGRLIVDNVWGDIIL